MEKKLKTPFLCSYLRRIRHWYLSDGARWRRGGTHGGDAQGLPRPSLVELGRWLTSGRCCHRGSSRLCWCPPVELVNVLLFLCRSQSVRYIFDWILRVSVVVPYFDIPPSVDPGPYTEHIFAAPDTQDRPADLIARLGELVADYG